MSSIPSSPTPASPSAHAQPPRPWYRREPGVALCLSGFVPVALGIALPRGAHVPLFAIAALLTLAGLVLIVRQEVRRGPRVPPPQDD
jgi:hypothetical protein